MRPPYLIPIVALLLVAARCRDRDREKEAPPSGFPSRTLEKGNVEVRLRAGEIVNTFYILDAVSGYRSSRQATVEPFRGAWEGAHPRHGKLEKLLEEYCLLRRSYGFDRGLMPGERLGARVPVDPSWERCSPADRFDLLVDRARSWDEFWEDLELVMSGEDAERMHAIVGGLSGDVRGLLETCPGLGDVPSRAAAEIEAEGFMDFLEEVRSFYGIPGSRKLKIDVSFVMLPGGGGLTHASRRDRFIVVEAPVCRGVKAGLRMDVLAHEACHVAEGMLGREEWERIAAKYFAAGEPSLSAGWWVLHEALATSLGQGVFLSRCDPGNYEEKQKIALGFYNDPLIDAYARAVEPSVRRALEDGATLEAFASEAGRIFAAGVDPEHEHFLKRGFLFCGAETYGAVDRRLYRTGGAGLWSFPLEDSGEGIEFAEAYLALSGLIVAAGGERDRAGELFGRLGCGPVEVLHEAEGGEITVLRKKRPISGYVYYAAVERPSLVEEALGKILSSP